MNEAGLVVIIVLLFYIIYEIKNSQEKKERQEKSECPFQKVLPEFLGKTCEIVLKEPLVTIDAVFSVKGVLIDADDEWVVMETCNRKKKSTKIFRIENISGINEFSDTIEK